MLRPRSLLHLLLLSGVIEGLGGDVAWLGRQVVTQDALARAEAAAKRAEHGLPAHLVRHRRVLSGVGRAWGEQAITFLHEELLSTPPAADPAAAIDAAGHAAGAPGSAGEAALEELLRELATRADAEVGWDVTAGGERQLRLRCAEVREYGQTATSVAELAGGAAASDEADAPHSGWHDLGGTVLALAVPLRGPEGGQKDNGEEEGVEVEVRRHGAPQDSQARPWRAAARPGDAVVWRGWHEHRVPPPAAGEGRRRLLVLEWWLSPREPPAAGRPADSEESLREALDIDPDSAVLNLNLGTTLHERSRRAEARGHFSRALALAPAWERAAGRAGAALAFEGHAAAREEAESLLRAAATLRPSSPHPHAGLAQLAAASGDGAAADAHVATALRAATPRGGDAGVFSLLAALRGGAGAEAEAAFRKAIEIEPHDAGLHHSLGVALARGGAAPAAAEAALMRAAEVDPQGPALFDLGVLLSERGDAKGAAMRYQDAIRANPADVRPHVNLGLQLLQAKNIQVAKRRFQAALGIDPSDLKAMQHLAQAHVASGEGEAAVKVLKRAVQAHPKEASAHLALGLQLWELRGAPSPAVLKQLRAAVRLAPSDDEVHFNLGLAHDRAGKFKEAAASFRAALELNPADEEYPEKLQAAEEMVDSEEDFSDESGEDDAAQEDGEDDDDGAELASESDEEDQDWEEAEDEEEEGEEEDMEPRQNSGAASSLYDVGAGEPFDEEAEGNLYATEL